MKKEARKDNKDSWSTRYNSSNYSSNIIINAKKKYQETVI